MIAALTKKRTAKTLTSNLEVGPDGKIRASNVFARLAKAHATGKYTVHVLEGGSRSSKTYSIIQFLLIYAQENIGNEKRVIISRAVGTWIKGTVLHDFLKILKAYGWYDKKNFNKTDKVYKLFDTEFWFVGLDDQQRLHGMTSDVFWINEAMEASKDDFDQLEQRCNEFAILDYNPSEEEHWIYDSVLKREDASYTHSTQLDNPFLPRKIRRKILGYEPTEENYRRGTADKRKWEIYGLGKRAKLEGLIYENFDVIDRIPEWIKKRYQGIDFGYTQDPTAIVEVAIHDNTVYIDEQCYKTRMLAKDIVSELKQTNNKLKIISESADPRLLDEISLAGLNIHPVEKGQGSVIAGIDKLKGMRIVVTKRSLNAIMELKRYTYKQNKDGKYLNEPVDEYNHILDAVRYVILMEVLGKVTKKKKLKGIFH